MADAMGLTVLVGAVIAIVVIGLIATFGLDMLTDLRDDSCASAYTYNTTSGVCQQNANISITTTTTMLNATNDAVSGVAKIPDKLPLLAGAVVAVVIIVLLVRWFRF